MEGYCPLATYLGVDGFCLELALRPGVQNPSKESDFNLEHVIPMAQRLSAVGPTAPFLARLNSDFDSAALMRSIEARNRTGLIGSEQCRYPDAIGSNEGTVRIQAPERESSPSSKASLPLSRRPTHFHF
ncbi:MAG: hypothetical protein IV088_03065 [Hydrogenophaga sp.]|nr:hypothetical protein [Hydrogenophaga sp.]